MRPLLAITCCIILLGGMKLYMDVRAKYRPPPVDLLEEEATGEFSLEITATFAAGPDAFALDPDDAPSVLVTFRNEEILRETEAVPAGETVPVAVPSVIQGESDFSGQNELYVSVSPTPGGPAVPHAIHVRLLRDGHEVAKKTLWSSDPAAPVSGVVRFAVLASDDAHDHAQD